MEGVKILSEEMIKIFGGSTLFPFLIFLGILILIFGICLISYYGFVEVASIVEILIGVMLVTISIIGSEFRVYYTNSREIYASFRLESIRDIVLFQDGVVNNSVKILVREFEVVEEN